MIHRRFLQHWHHAHPQSILRTHLWMQQNHQLVLAHRPWQPQFLQQQGFPSPRQVCQTKSGKFCWTLTLLQTDSSSTATVTHFPQADFASWASTAVHHILDCHPMPRGSPQQRRHSYHAVQPTVPRVTGSTVALADVIEVWNGVSHMQNGAAKFASAQLATQAFVIAARMMTRHLFIPLRCVIDAPASLSLLVTAIYVLT